MPLVDLSVLIFLLAAVGCTLMLFRNNAVFNYRSELLARISRANIQDLGNPSFCELMEKRYKMFESVSYNTMFLQVWKPVSSFYPEEFLRELPNLD